MSKFYIENRIWYIGYSWIDLSVNKDEISNGLLNSKLISEQSQINIRPFLFNNYEVNDLLVVSYEKQHLKNQFINNYFEINTIEIKFLKNGCAQIESVFIPKKQEFFDERIVNIDLEGSETFDQYNEEIILKLHPILQFLINTNIVKCNENSLWGIHALLSKKPLDLDKIQSFALTSDNMHGDKNLYYSVLYIQHIVSKEEKDYKQFCSTGNIKCELLELSCIKESNKKIKTSMAWGRKYWNFDSILEIKEFLEVEAIHLSKIVIATVSINFNTELSMVLLKDNELKEKASADTLRNQVSLLRVHIACTETLTQDFSEGAEFFYGKMEDFERIKTQEKLRLQKESEEILLQISDTHTINNNQIKSEWFNFFLAVITTLTIFSVIQDVSSFVFVEEKNLKLEDFRFSIISTISVLLIILLLKFKPSKIKT